MFYSSRNDFFLENSFVLFDLNYFKPEFFKNLGLNTHIYFLCPCLVHFIQNIFFHLRITELIAMWNYFQFISCVGQPFYCLLPE